MTAAPTARSPYRRLRRFARERLNRRGRRIATVTHGGVDTAYRLADSFNDGRQDWSVLTAFVGDVREITDLANEPWLLGRFDRSGIDTLDASFVADPFVFHADDRWYLFVEVWDRAVARGIIGVADSADGRTWTWVGEALREPFHLSYPHVFRHDGRILMVPETGEAGAVRLYEATSFPTGWELVGELFQHPSLCDASLFRHDDRWWCFADTTLRSDRLELFAVEDLVPGARWTPHPSSPLVRDDKRRARPAGAPIEIGGRLHRLSQVCRPRYGTAVRAFAIDQLDGTTYREDDYGFVLLHPSGRHANRSGTHHLSTAARPGGDELLVAFDGY